MQVVASFGFWQVVCTQNNLSEILPDIFLTFKIVLHKVVIAFWGFHGVWNKICNNGEDYWRIKLLRNVRYQIQKIHLDVDFKLLVWFVVFFFL